MLFCNRQTNGMIGIMNDGFNHDMSPCRTKRLIDEAYYNNVFQINVITNFKHKNCYSDDDL
jgi:hypothetical protein